MAPAALLKSQALRSGAVAHKARAPVRGMARRCTMPVQATIAFVETVSLSEERVHTRQRVQEVQEVIALKIKEAAVEAPARRMHRDRVLMAACIKAAALQHILATTHFM